MTWEGPLMLLALLVWLQSPPATFADAARREALRRQVVPQATQSLSNADVASAPVRPLPTPPADAVAGDESAAKSGAAEASEAAAPGAAEQGETKDEAWWRSRLADVRSALERDQLLGEALQSRVNALTNDWSARDDPAQRQALWDERQQTLEELARMKDQIEADRKAIDEVQTEARRADVPAEWVR